MAVGLIGKYERLDVLGHGTSGVVYLAWDTLLRRQVALKEIRVDGPELDRVLGEARVLDRLRHPNIVHVNGVDQVDGIVLIDMELVRGRNLAQTLRDAGGGPLPMEQAVNVALAVLSALGYAHERRIVHRDVKPANILVADDGTIKLTDFGLAEALGTGSLAGGGGTYPYMAPEDFAEDASSDYRSDLWAVGVMLYEMLAGRRPFVAQQRAKDPFVWKRIIEQEEPPRLLELRPDLSPELGDVLARALSKPKSARYPTAAVFADTLRAAAAATAQARPVVIKASGPEALAEELPDSPIVFGNGAAVVETLDELLTAAAKHWDEARRALFDGRIERFLRAIGEVYIADLAAELSQRRNVSGENPDRLLREFLNRSRNEEEERSDAAATIPLIGGASRGGARRRFPRVRMPFAPTPDEESSGDDEVTPEDEPKTAPAFAFIPTPQPVPVQHPHNREAIPGGAAYKREDRRAAKEARKAAARAAKVPVPVSATSQDAVRHRWWFWPLFLLTIAPPVFAIAAAHNSGIETRWHNLLTAWTTTGIFGAMLLLICIGVRLPGLARAICALPIAMGLVTAGALASRMLTETPQADGLARVAIASLLPLGVLLVEASTVARYWRAWVALMLIGCVLATVHFAGVAH